MCGGVVIVLNVYSFLLSVFTFCFGFDIHVLVDVMNGDDPSLSEYILCDLCIYLKHNKC